MAGLFGGKKGKSSGSSISKFRLLLEGEPDKPRGFGYKTTWLAVRCMPQELVDVLGLSDVGAANWESGLESTASGGIFITSQIRGWSLAVGLSLPSPNEQDVGQQRMFLDLMEVLAARFGDVQLFSTHRVVEYHAWVRMRGGEPERVFAYLGEQGAVVANSGETTPDETDLGLPDMTDLSIESATDRLWEAAQARDAIVDAKSLNDPIPSEEAVITLAGIWSVNPTQIEEMGLPDSVGMAGVLPARFRMSGQMG